MHDSSKPGLVTFQADEDPVYFRAESCINPCILNLDDTYVARQGQEGLNKTDNIGNRPISTTHVTINSHCYIG